MKKTLGGERLGSGNRMKVDLHGFERSTHDLSYIWRSTMASGTLVPFLKELALPGDTFDIHLNCDVKTHPTIGPLFGSFKVQLDVFSIPIRLYHSALHNNRLGIGMNMAQIKLPQIQLNATPTTASTSDIDNSQVNPSCIMSYLGIRGVGIAPGIEIATEPVYRDFNGVPFLAYWDIYKNYYANKQEEVGYVISKFNTLVLNETVTSIQIGPIDTLIVLPHLPTAGTVRFDRNDLLIINYTGAVPDPTMIFVAFYAGGTIAINDLAQDGLWDDNGTSLIALYDFNRWGNMIAAGWDYINLTTQINGSPSLEQFPLEDIDKMRDAILTSPWNAQFYVNAAAETDNLLPYRYVLSVADLGTDINYPLTQCNQEGLGIKTYQSDLFNNWLSTEWIDGAGGINEITAVDTTSGSFNIDALNLSKKVYDMLNRIAVSGGSYKDWLNAQYDHDVFTGAESPVYCGGLIKELTFQEVVSNSQSIGDNGEQPLGTLAGKGVMAGKHKGGTVIVKVNEPSYIMGIISLTPRVDYSQGNKWDTHLQTMNDLHVPSLDQIGFQELITEQMAWWSTRKIIATPIWETKSAGKQPAWINYMTNVNEVRGNFAVKNNEMFMTLNRRYEPEQVDTDNIGIKDLTTYVDPTKFNHIFAQTSLDAQNFWTQISIDMTARRKMSAKVMPNL